MPIPHELLYVGTAQLHKSQEHVSDTVPNCLAPFPLITVRAINSDGERWRGWQNNLQIGIGQIHSSVD